MENGIFDQLADRIRSSSKLMPRGGHTKTGIPLPEHVENIDLSQLSGMREYNPSEYTFTAYAGTPLKEINQVLEEHGQFLPFDPLLVDHGATLGGTLAANLNGPGRYYYGGVRDYILGVQFLDGQGRLIHSGGKVVKNAAGFDLPKLMVGSLGSLGIVVEISMKVFPKPKEFITVVAQYGKIADALEDLIELASSPLEILCLELEPGDNSYILKLRLGGTSKLFPERLSSLGKYLNEFETLEGDPESELWAGLREFEWVPDDGALVKIPSTPKIILELDSFLNSKGMMRRYSAGANIAWVASRKPIKELDRGLRKLNLSGLTILGDAGRVRFGAFEQGAFYRKIKAALDPSGKWIEV